MPRIGPLRTEICQKNVTLCIDCNAETDGVVFCQLGLVAAQNGLTKTELVQRLRNNDYLEFSAEANVVAYRPSQKAIDEDLVRSNRGVAYWRTNLPDLIPA